LRILVVEDNHDIRSLMVDILSSAHHQVETAENGAAALSKYANFNPDIVTLDLSMPIMDGYETLMRIMKMDSNASVIMVTAVENQELIDQCFHRGAIGYITKPFTASQLVNSISIAQNAASSDRKMVAAFSNAIVGMEDAIKKSPWASLKKSSPNAR
jgi:two-component system chemotaxis response regulator CheY